MKATSTGTSANVLTDKDIRRAIKLLEENSKAPYLMAIHSKYEWWKLIKKSADVRGFSLYGGIPCHQDSTIPANIARFMMSDGTHKDITITEGPNFIPIQPIP